MAPISAARNLHVLTRVVFLVHKVRYQDVFCSLEHRKSIMSENVKNVILSNLILTGVARSAFFFCHFLFNFLLINILFCFVVALCDLVLL